MQTCSPRSSSRIPHILEIIQAKHCLRLRQCSVSRALTPAPDLRLQRGISPKSLTRHKTTSARKAPPRATPIARPPKNAISTDTGVVGPQGRNPGPMIWASSAFGFCIAVYISYVYVSATRTSERYEKLNLPQNADVSYRWKDQTRDFDDEVNASEKLMWIKAKRKRMVNEAYGNVLEVSVGTGRNMQLYDLRPYDPTEDESSGRSRMRIIRSLTFNDQSEVMVAQAEEKFEKMEAERKKKDRFNGPVKFIVGDAGVSGVVPRPLGGYDTIVQSMGVCSMVDGAGFLRTLGKLCRQPGEASQYGAVEGDDGRGGKILLLEHGRGHYDWLNKYLDSGAKGHAAHYGCWWNKDIGQIIEESGLKVERMRRFNFGTTWEIVLRPA